MKNCIKIEIWKAIHNKMFLLSILIGLIIVCIHFFEVLVDIESLVSQILSAPKRNGNVCYDGISLFIHWIGIDWYHYSSRLFFLLWPILAALPFGWSYAQDRQIGVFNQVVIRCNKNIYFLSKYIAVFLTGGMAITIPVLVDLFALATICPDKCLDVVDALVAVYNGCFQSRLFYTHPWIYALFWCGIDFFWGGTTACICFILGSKIRFSFVNILIPFISYFLFDILYSWVRQYIFIDKLFSLIISPLRLAQASTGANNPESVILTVLLLLTLATLIIGHLQVINNELD